MKLAISGSFLAAALLAASCMAHAEDVVRPPLIAVDSDGMLLQKMPLHSETNAAISGNPLPKNATLIDSSASAAHLPPSVAAVVGSTNGTADTSTILRSRVQGLLSGTKNAIADAYNKHGTKKNALRAAAVLGTLVAVDYGAHKYMTHVPHDHQYMHAKTDYMPEYQKEQWLLLQALTVKDFANAAIGNPKCLQEYVNKMLDFLMMALLLGFEEPADIVENLKQENDDYFDFNDDDESIKETAQIYSYFKEHVYVNTSKDGWNLSPFERAEAKPRAQQVLIERIRHARKTLPLAMLAIDNHLSRFPTTMTKFRKDVTRRWEQRLKNRPYIEKKLNEFYEATRLQEERELLDRLGISQVEDEDEDVSLLTDAEAIAAAERRDQENLFSAVNRDNRIPPWQQGEKPNDDYRPLSTWSRLAKFFTDGYKRQKRIRHKRAHIAAAAAAEEDQEEEE